MTAPTSYSAATWYDDAAGGTPIDALALNRIEQGVAGAYQYTGQLYLTPTTTVTGNYNANPGDFIQGNASSAGFTVVLPTARAGIFVAIKKLDSTSNLISINTTNNQTIDGVVPSGVAIRLQNEVRIYQGTANGWLVLSGLNTVAALDARYQAMFMPQNFGFHATLSADVTLAAGTSAQATSWNVNTNNGFTYSAGALTIPTMTGGNYRWRVQFHGQLGNASGARLLQINRNSTTVSATNTLAIMPTINSGSVDGDNIDVIYQGALNAGDVLRFFAYSATASVLHAANIITAAPYDTWIDVAPIGLA